MRNLNIALPYQYQSIGDTFVQWIVPRANRILPPTNGLARFGLAIAGQPEHDVFIGFYGTFLEALEGM